MHPKDVRMTTDKMDMQIQGSHMKFGAMNGLRPQQGGSAESFGQMLVDKPGKRLGQLAKAIGLDPAHAALTPAADALAKAPGQNKAPVDGIPSKSTQTSLNGELTLGAVFANEVIRRLESGDEPGLDSEGQPKDSEDLRHSLGQTMDWIRDRFGDDTAAAAAGMVLQSTASGVNEDTLADGLLNSLKFIDRNFGFAAGDEAIAKFNGTLNGEINDFFENGSEELFYAVETSADSASPMQEMGNRIVLEKPRDNDDGYEKDGDTDAKSLTEQLLDKLKEELDGVAELQDMTTQIEAEVSITVQANFAISAYSNQSAPVEPQFTSQAV